jgi:hypothetical protein
VFRRKGGKKREDRVRARGGKQASSADDSIPDPRVSLAHSSAEQQQETRTGERRERARCLAEQAREEREERTSLSFAHQARPEKSEETVRPMRLGWDARLVGEAPG